MNANIFRFSNTIIQCVENFLQWLELLSQFCFCVSQHIDKIWWLDRQVGKVNCKLYLCQCKKFPKIIYYRSGCRSLHATTGCAQIEHSCLQRTTEHRSIFAPFARLENVGHSEAGVWKSEQSGAVFRAHLLEPTSQSLRACWQYNRKSRGAVPFLELVQGASFAGVGCRRGCRHHGKRHRWCYRGKVRISTGTLVTLQVKYCDDNYVVFGIELSIIRVEEWNVTEYWLLLLT